ncbi:hypothetical protein LGQ02_04415 [Bacillus shivajii]|uniref:hypothetical protein n=1 Tax=Bacillus shivajii TaxID=1983719 RepID=UPI001CFBC2DA|nr:hypothetical protein [Bacillus shivajii]UCZ54034.1 hypothetical protein LGQ02_04415 [Bacillus shivajii]
MSNRKVNENQLTRIDGEMVILINHFKVLTTNICAFYPFMTCLVDKREEEFYCLLSEMVIHLCYYENNTPTNI